MQAHRLMLISVNASLQLKWYVAHIRVTNDVQVSTGGRSYVKTQYFFKPGQLPDNYHQVLRMTPPWLTCLLGLLCCLWCLCNLL